MVRLKGSKHRTIAPQFPRQFVHMHALGDPERLVDAAFNPGHVSERPKKHRDTHRRAKRKHAKSARKITRRNR